MPRCPDAHMPICPYARMPMCPYAQMPICPYAHMPKCPFLAIWAYGHVGICEKIWPNGVSPKRASKMQLRDVDLRSVGHSNQKL